MRPKFCSNCAAELPPGSQGAQKMTTGGPDPEDGWDCFCRTCKWSGDIFPDFESETALEKAQMELNGT